MWKPIPIAAIALALAAGMASPVWPAGHGEAPPRFRLEILMADWQDLEHAQDWESAWPRLEKAAGKDLLSLDERDVAAYDWPAQRIVLRPEASLRLLAAAQKLPDMPERLYKLRALWSTDDLIDIVNPRGFVVSLDGRPLYGGIFLSKTSNLSMRYPVIHAAMDDSRRIVLRFSPIQFSFGSLWDNGTGDALESPAHPALSEIQSVFPDVLERMSPEGREEIETFKRLILDSRIKALFADLGTPAQPPAVPAVENRSGHRSSSPPIPFPGMPTRAGPSTSGTPTTTSPRSAIGSPVIRIGASPAVMARRRSGSSVPAATGSRSRPLTLPASEQAGMRCGSIRSAKRF